MSEDEKIAFQNIKKLLLNGSFQLNGIEAIAFVKALKIFDDFLSKNLAPVVKPGPISEKKNANKSLRST